MKTANFTEFRKNAKKYIDAVERGEKIRITRHGRPVAEIVPASRDGDESWKTAPLLLRIKGVSLSEEILKEREESRK